MQTQANNPASTLMKEMAPGQDVLYNFIDKMNNDAELGDYRTAQVKNILKLIIVDYLKEVKDIRNDLLRLSLYIVDTQVLIWVEIADDDSKTEKTLFLKEALINSRYFANGYSLDTTIVEQRDKISSPKHYLNLLQ